MAGREHKEAGREGYKKDCEREDCREGGREGYELGKVMRGRA